MIEPADFGPVGTADDTATVQAALNAAVLHQEPLRIEKMHFVSTVQISGANRAVIVGDGVLKGIGPLPGRKAVLEVVNSVAVKVDGLNCDASHIGAYDAAFKFWANASAGAFNVNTFAINCQNAKLGMQFGDAAYPDLAISENTVHHGYFYACAQGFYVVGSQAVLSIDHFQNITDNSNLPSIEQVGIIAEGSTVVVTGGEIMGAGNPNHSAIVNKAFNSALYGQAYGRVALRGVAVETAGRMMRSDPNGCGAPARGGMSVDARGYLGGNSAHYVELDPLWDGTIDFLPGCDFHGTPARTKATVYANPKPGGGVNGKALISIADNTFSGGMPIGAAAVVGGVYRHGMEAVLDARNTGNQPISGSGWTHVAYNENHVSGPRQAACFNGHTYTVGAGGHKSAIVTFVAPSNIPVCELSVRLNGAEVSNVRAAYTSQIVCLLNNLVQGDQITTHINGLGVSGIIAGGAKDRFQIMAST